VERVGTGLAPISEQKKRVGGQKRESWGEKPLRADTLKGIKRSSGGKGGEGLRGKKTQGDEVRMN